MSKGRPEMQGGWEAASRAKRTRPLSPSCSTQGVPGEKLQQTMPAKVGPEAEASA